MFLVRLRTNEEVKRQKVAKETSVAAASETAVKKVPVRNTGKVGPNDPCPCGSGKKYKKCCRDKDVAAGMEQ
jgi:preprotein translocase subunit SecA